jgi:uncharacterized protein (TIGR03067 family)
MLAKWLVRHNLAISGGALSVALSPSATSACMSVSVVSSTTKAAMLAAAGQTATGLISVQVAALMEGVLKAMFLTKVKSVMGVMLVAASLCGAAGLIYQTQAAEQGKAPQVHEKTDQKKPLTAKNDENRKTNNPRRPIDDRHAIRGAWRVISVQQGNEEIADKEAAIWEKSRWVIRAESIDIRMQDGGGVGLAYKLDPSSSPKLLDLRILGHTIPAIYALESDVLQIRMSLHGTTPPKALSNEDGDNTLLLILKREPDLTRKVHDATERAKKMKKVLSYRGMFLKTLGIVAEQFEQITYADQYEGRIEARTVDVKGSGLIREAIVSFLPDNNGLSITATVNKIKTVGGISKVVGRDEDLEQVILQMKAQKER